MNIPKKFVGTHSHCGNSSFDGFGSPQKHIDFCIENGLDAWACTDHGHMNAYATISLLKEKLKKTNPNFKVLCGAELYIHPDLEQWKLDFEKDKELKNNVKEAKKLAKQNKEQNKSTIDLIKSGDDDEVEEIETTNNLTIENEEESKSISKHFNPLNRRHHLVVLPKNSAGLKSLFKLVSRGYAEGFYRFPRIDYKMLKEAGKDGNLIIQSACLHPETKLITNLGIKTILEVVNLFENKEIIKVLSFNIELNKVVFETVSWGSKTREKSKLFQIKLKNGKILKLTYDHKVYTDQGWVEVQFLTKNHKILSI